MTGPHKAGPARKSAPHGPFSHCRRTQRDGLKGKGGGGARRAVSGPGGLDWGGLGNEKGCCRRLRLGKCMGSVQVMD